MAEGHATQPAGNKMRKPKSLAMGLPDSKTELEKGLVMGTNGSSIVSKRSVEQLYYPEPHFIRYFVKKRQRRSPLINRGYWLRMYAIEHSVRTFLKEDSEQPKIVLNFGCGFDPLPFQFLTNEPTLCQNVRFIDVDYHKLMIEKRNTIRDTDALAAVIPDAEFLLEENAVLIRSKRYLGIGCDLSEPKKLEDVLRSELGSISDFSIVCTAEVSLTYMDVKSADNLLQWASSISDDSRFYLLEQYFPDGPDHPFATTMMGHFHKLRTPLYSIHEYPLLRDQEDRFLKAGWRHASARSLWNLWSDSEFLTDVQRESLDKVETFDEWEEFALFASHYFLLYASTKSLGLPCDRQDVAEQIDSGPQDFKLVPQCPLRFNGQRRFGAIVPVKGNAVGLHGGLGLQTRLSTTQVYSALEVRHSIHDIPPADIRARMCHSTTNFDGLSLLSGGRASPTMPFGDCWLKKDGKWNQIDSLPVPCFRHATTEVDMGQYGKFVLLYGGKSATGQVLDTFFAWSEGGGWVEVYAEYTPPPRFGPMLFSLQEQRGILAGGMSQGGVVLTDFWHWKLYMAGTGELVIQFFENWAHKLSALTPFYRWLGRFGSSIERVGDQIAIIGGITNDGCIPRPYEIVILKFGALRGILGFWDVPSSDTLCTIGLGVDFNGPRPLLIGHSSIAVGEDEILIVGGGGVCFSFGTFWNGGSWLLQAATPNAANEWLLVAPASSSEQTSLRTISVTPQPVIDSASTVVTIPRVKISSAQEFRTILDKAKPVILEGCNIGPCVKLWTKQYLKDSVGVDRKVVVHESKSEHMDFQTKNFAYVTKEFGTFLDEVYAGSRQYLRAISASKPTEEPANLATDFPGLKADFHLPPELSFVSENAHSSPLRISGPVILWLHYDVLANVLCQIRGEKKLILFPPGDVSKLSFAAGSSSSSINVFSTSTTTGNDSQTAYPSGTTPHEAALHPGDILFLPPLWLHTACPTTGGDDGGDSGASSDSISVAVNVFFRNLADGIYSPGRDVYGNRDLHAYEKGRRDVEKIVRSFDRLPRDVARFYIDRLADELRGGGEGT